MKKSTQEDLDYLRRSLISNNSSLISYKSHSGKSKHLLELAKRPIQSLSRPNSEMTALIYVDCKMFPISLRAEKFWHHILKKVEARKNISEEFRAMIKEFIQGDDYDAFELKMFFDELQENGYLLALLLDRVDFILRCSQETIRDIFSSLRAISSQSKGLVLTMAANRRAEELNDITAHLNPHGSPYFNTYKEIIK